MKRRSFLQSMGLAALGCSFAPIGDLAKAFSAVLCDDWRIQCGHRKTGIPIEQAVKNISPFT